LIDDLSLPEAYNHPVEDVEVIHTHISLVFLAGDHAYKVKKPVDLGFLDYTSLEKRRHYCNEEVRLNRRLASGVYNGVVPIVLRGGRHHVGGEGEIVEYAVSMRRLPASATLANRIANADVSRSQIESIARRLAEFHKSAEGGNARSSLGA
jgi:hypothetical protein